MKIKQFCIKHKFSGSDTKIAQKVYGSAEKTEAEWVSELKDKFNFDYEYAEKLLKATAIKNKKSSFKKDEKKSSSKDNNKK